MVQSDYKSVRDSMRPGDVIAFSGSGFISDAIKLFTRSCVSHVGVIFETFQNDCETDGRRRVKLMESTTLNGLNGVQETFLSDRLDSYDGPMWWLPLSERTRTNMDSARFWRTLYDCRGRKYDYRQVFHHAVDILHLWAQAESPGRLFCSELVALALKSSYAIPAWIDSSEVTPQGLCEMKIFAPNCHQLKGKPQEIRCYNSRNPLDWRNG